MISFDQGCESYWSMADALPVDVVIDYSCNKNPVCKEAKRHALLSALDRGDVKYRRSDGKDFKDPVYDLYARGVLLVERESFLAWAGEISNEVEAKNISDTLDLKPKAETTYLNIIGALLDVVEKGIPDGKGLHSGKKIGPAPGFTSEAALISAISQYCDRIQGMSERTLQSKFPAVRRSLDSQ